MSLTENKNKENIPISPRKEVAYNLNNGQDHMIKKLQQDVYKLEKLYKDEVIKSQTALSEQERLDVEILQKEKSILAQQQSLQKMTDLNKSLSKKLSSETSFYENLLANYKRLERDWDERLRKLKVGNLKHEHLLKKKNDELAEINQELEYVKNEMDNKDNELVKLRSQLSSALNELENAEGKHEADHSVLRTNNNNNDDDDDESCDEGELSSMVLPDYDEEEEEEEVDGNDTINSSSLANEINNKININDQIIKKYEFEIKSLKNEKHQLYNYINRLLKNKPHPNQNTILKEKLVKRRILRAISINQITQKIPQALTGGKRVVSNIVNFKSSYQSLKRRDVYKDQNSDIDESGDEEDVDEDEIRILGNQNLGHSLFKPTLYLMKPTELFFKANNDETDLDIDLDID